MADDGAVLLAVVVLWAWSQHVSPSPKPAPPLPPSPPKPPPLPPKPAPGGFPFKKGGRYVLTLDFENQATELPRPTTWPTSTR